MISELGNVTAINITDIIKNININFTSVKKEKVDELKKLDRSLGILAKLINIFHNECLNRIPEMKVFCQNYDFENLSRVVHRFKSTTYNLGASRSVEIIKQIEYTVSLGETYQPTTLKLIEELEYECMTVHELLQLNLLQPAECPLEA